MRSVGRILEGIGAALVLPALVALVAGNYEGKDRITAYAIIGGIAGAGIAVGPIVGGAATTYLSWRVVFVGEVAIALIILATTRFIVDIKADRRPHLDWVGSILTALGLGMIVFGFLQASTWGWIEPKNSPIEPLGFSLTPFMVAAGVGVLWIFRWWEGVREGRNEDRLIKLELLQIPRLRSGTPVVRRTEPDPDGRLLHESPLYLQLVVGLDALETGIRMLPISIAMFITSTSGSFLAARWSARSIVRVGLVCIFVSILVLIGTIEPELEGFKFSAAMALLGVGMGLLASQLGNVVQSSVGQSDRSEAGGLQWTSQQLGSALGVAIIGSIVLTGLTNNFVTNVAQDERVAESVQEEVAVEVADGVEFVSSEQIRDGLEQTELDAGTTDAIVESYEDAQLRALKAGLLAAALLAGAALLVTGNLPSEVYKEDDDAGEADGEPSEATPT